MEHSKGLITLMIFSFVRGTLSVFYCDVKREERGIFADQMRDLSNGGEQGGANKEENNSSKNLQNLPG